MALGNLELAYRSFRRAYELKKDVEAVPRELAGVCLELGKFNEAVSVAEKAVALDPGNTGLLGNLALTYLLAGRVAKAQKSIAGALKITQSDKINNYLAQSSEKWRRASDPARSHLRPFHRRRLDPRRSSGSFGRSSSRLRRQTAWHVEPRKTEPSQDKRQGQEEALIAANGFPSIWALGYCCWALGSPSTLTRGAALISTLSLSRSSATARRMRSMVSTSALAICTATDMRPTLSASSFFFSTSFSNEASCSVETSSSYPSGGSQPAA